LWRVEFFGILPFGYAQGQDDSVFVLGQKLGQKDDRVFLTRSSLDKVVDHAG
jgi:hypothetical protein